MTWSENTYFVSELMEDKKGFYVMRKSENVHMEIGSSWKLTTIGGNKYTIFFERTQKDPNFILLSNEEY